MAINKTSVVRMSFFCTICLRLPLRTRDSLEAKKKRHFSEAHFSHSGQWQQNGQVLRTTNIYIKQSLFRLTSAGLGNTNLGEKQLCRKHPGQRSWGNENTTPTSAGSTKNSSRVSKGALDRVVPRNLARLGIASIWYKIRHRKAIADCPLVEGSRRPTSSSSIPL